MFFLVGVIYDRAHHRDLDNFRGLMEPMPLYGGISAIIFFASMGLPGLCGFVGEVFVVLGDVELQPGAGVPGRADGGPDGGVHPLDLAARLLRHQPGVQGLPGHGRARGDRSQRRWSCCRWLLGIFPSYFLLSWMEPSIAGLVERCRWPDVRLHDVPSPDRRYTLLGDLLVFLPEVVSERRPSSRCCWCEWLAAFDESHLGCFAGVSCCSSCVWRNNVEIWRQPEIGQPISDASPAWSSAIRSLLYVRFIILGASALTIILTLLTGIPDREDSADFHVLLLGGTLGMMLMASANHLLMAFIAVEMASLPSYALAGFLKGKRQSSEAALKYVVYGGGASGVMLYGISLIAGKFGTGYLPDVAAGYAAVFSYHAQGGVDAVAGHGHAVHAGRAGVQALGGAVPLLVPGRVRGRGRGGRGVPVGSVEGRRRSP